jgi:murein L,D-transpeptidase YafK
MRHILCRLALFAAGLTGLGMALPAVADDPAIGTQRTAYTGGSAALQSNRLPTADLIVVRKSERRLDLMRNGEVLRSYRIALGLQPTGHKERSGDFRTPEGRYRLTRRNPRSDYFLSIQISYPNDQDVRYAKSNGWDPGGAIMIHGLPNVLKKDVTYYQTRDWTDGCIAVSNSDMVEIWLLTHENTPIEILP